MRPIIPVALIVVGVVLLGLGCGHKSAPECSVRCTVIDADTRAPLDSASVYVTYVDYFGVSHARHFVGLTDENGELTARGIGCKGFNIIDVEREGYLPSRQVVHEGEDLVFVLEQVSLGSSRVARDALGSYWLSS